MRRMGGIADQHDLAVMPALADARDWKLSHAEPRRWLALLCSAVAVEIAAEELLAEGDRLRGVEPVQAVRLPGLLARLDDDRGEILAELVGVDLEPAVLGPLEGEGEGREGLGGAQPDEAAFAHVDVGLEYGRVPVAGAAVDAVGGDDEVGVGEAPLVVHLMLGSSACTPSSWARSCRICSRRLAADAGRSRGRR